MPHQFKPGDAVLVIGGPRRGETAVVESALRLAPTWSPWHMKHGRVAGHQLSIQSLRPGHVVWAKPEWLLPLLPDSTSDLYSETESTPAGVKAIANEESK